MFYQVRICSLSRQWIYFTPELTVPGRQTCGNQSVDSWFYSSGDSNDRTGLTFAEHVLCIRSCAEHCTCPTNLNLTAALWDRCYYQTCVIGEETESLLRHPAFPKASLAGNGTYSWRNSHCKGSGAVGAEMVSCIRSEHTVSCFVSVYKAC